MSRQPITGAARSVSNTVERGMNYLRDRPEAQGKTRTQTEADRRPKWQGTARTQPKAE